MSVSRAPSQGVRCFAGSSPGIPPVRTPAKPRHAGHSRTCRSNLRIGSSFPKRGHYRHQTSSGRQPNLPHASGRFRKPGCPDAALAVALAETPDRSAERATLASSSSSRTRSTTPKRTALWRFRNTGTLRYNLIRTGRIIRPAGKLVLSTNSNDTHEEGLRYALRVLNFAT